MCGLPSLLDFCALTRPTARNARVIAALRFDEDVEWERTLRYVIRVRLLGTSGHGPAIPLTACRPVFVSPAVNGIRARKPDGRGCADAPRRFESKEPLMLLDYGPRENDPNASPCVKQCPVRGCLPITGV